MRDKAAKLWFSASSQIQLESTITSFLAEGLSLTNPFSGCITMISEFGDPIVAEKSDLLNAYRADNVVRFNLWMDASHNLFTEIGNSIDDGVILEFGLDGFDEKQLTRLTEIFVALFVDHIGSGAHALVVDWEGYSEGFDWVAWIDQSTGVPPTWPEVIAVPVPVASRSASAPSSQYSRMDIDGFAILFGPRLSLTLDQPDQPGHSPRFHVGI